MSTNPVIIDKPSAAAASPAPAIQPTPAAASAAAAPTFAPFLLGISGLQGNIDPRHNNVGAYEHSAPPAGRGGIHKLTLQVFATHEALAPPLARAAGRSAAFELDVIDNLKASREFRQWDTASSAITANLTMAISLRQKVAEAEATRDAALATASDDEFRVLDGAAGPLRNRIDRLNAERAKLFAELPSLENALMSCAKQIIAAKAAAVEATIKMQLDDLCGLLSGNANALELLVELDEFGKQIRFAAVSLAPLIVARITADSTAKAAAIAPPVSVPNVFAQPVGRAVRVG